MERRDAGSGDASDREPYEDSERSGSERSDADRSGPSRAGSEPEGAGDVGRTGRDAVPEPVPERAPRRRKTPASPSDPPDPPFGTARVSQLLRRMCSPEEQSAWTPARRRAHARALVALAADHWLAEDELVAIERLLG